MTSIPEFQSAITCGAIHLAVDRLQEQPSPTLRRRVFTSVFFRLVIRFFYQHALVRLPIMPLYQVSNQEYRLHTS
jgi:hypothetical protein